jgi:uncharacterized protein (TIGR00255 family)
MSILQTNTGPLSMTGFARKEAQHPWGQLICEVRSVNHRYLESNLKLSDALRSLEPQLRDTLRKTLARGKVDVVLTIQKEGQSELNLALNRDLAKAVVAMAAEISQFSANAAPLSSLEVLRWPGVLQSAGCDQEELEGAAQQLFTATLDQLIANRQREGAELGRFIEQRLLSIADQVAIIQARLPELMVQQQNKLRQRLQALAVEVDPDRLAQELGYLAQKADVAEELDRLQAHLAEIRHTLNQPEPIGRRLDFLMQELNREANTLSSKSTASETSQAAVNLKVLIEQIREQVQNIE